jgi:azurin
VSAGCAKITVELTHTGKLAKEVMGHNVVISKSRRHDAITTAGMGAGAAAGYVPKGDARVIAATPVVGGGASTKTSFAGQQAQGGRRLQLLLLVPRPLRDHERQAGSHQVRDLNAPA